MSPSRTGTAVDTGVMTGNDDWFATETAQMAPHEIRQRLIAEPRPGDDEPVAIQRQRLEKIALILDLYSFEQVGDPATVRTVIQYLRTESLEQKHGYGVLVPTASELGARIDALEWPVNPSS